MAEMTLEQKQALALAQARRRRAQAVNAPEPIDADPTEGMSFGQQVAAGAGARIADFGLGIKQMLGMGQPGELQEKRQMDAALMDTPGAGVGSLATDLSTLPVAGSIPGAARIAGSAAIGAGYGAVQPTDTQGQRAANVTIGAGLGAAGQAAGNRIAQAIGTKLGSRAAEAAGRAEAGSVRDQTIRAAQQAGYVLPPSTSNPSALNRGVEQLGGKIATQQQASLRNQEVTNNLARRALGLPENTPLSPEALQAVRQEASQVYRQIGQAGEIVPDARYLDDLAGLEQSIAKIANDFPDLNIGSRPEIRQLIDGLLVDRFSAQGALELTRTLRAEASGLFRQAGMGSGNPGARALAQATRDAADTVEEQIMRHLRANGGEQVADAFNAARRRIAIAHTVEDALIEGTGDVMARRLASDLGRGKPLSGELEVAARFAQAFPKATQRLDSSPVSLVNAGMTGAIGGGAAIATGNPLALAAGLAWPASRGLARSTALGPLQRNLKPNYKPNALGTAMLQGSRYPARRGGALAAVTALRDDQ